MKVMIKTSAVLAAVVLACGITARGQNYITPPAPAYVPEGQPELLAPQQLDQIVAPIALYPDPLLSQVLAAATYPQDVAAAQQWLQYFPNPVEEDIDAQPWDPSVKALVHYPSVMDMLASQPDWTAALGQAFATQPGAVMDAVQRLRAQAQAAGTLVSTPQQQVINDNGMIEILPAEPEVIYVPEYDPVVVYAPPRGVHQPWITFESGFVVGPWLDLDWDWHHRRFEQGVRWDRDWRHPDVDHVREWRHNPERPIPRPREIPDRPHGVAPGRGWEHPSPPPGAFHPGAPERPEQHPTPRAPQRPVNGLPSRTQQPPHPVEQPTPRPEPRPVPRPRPVQHPTEPTPPPTRERPVQGLPPRQSPTPTPAPPPRPAPPVQHPVERPSSPPPARGAPSPSPSPAPSRSPSAPPPAFHSDGGGADVHAARGSGSAGHR
jgi:hypothetical protein